MHYKRKSFPVDLRRRSLWPLLLSCDGHSCSSCMPMICDPMRRQPHAFPIYTCPYLTDTPCSGHVPIALLAQKGGCFLPLSPFSLRVFTQTRICWLLACIIISSRLYLFDCFKQIEFQFGSNLSREPCQTHILSSVHPRGWIPVCALSRVASLTLVLTKHACICRSGHCALDKSICPLGFAHPGHLGRSANRREVTTNCRHPQSLSNID
mmetsp:Transcript_47873/g.78854  ORF Transcript_47873/g.78854 Transcript_47873/m.78854 type:complete len:209 (+) Transcript_47873:134-760(+)